MPKKRQTPKTEVPPCYGPALNEVVEEYERAQTALANYRHDTNALFNLSSASSYLRGAKAMLVVYAGEEGCYAPGLPEFVSRACDHIHGAMHADNLIAEPSIRAEVLARANESKARADVVLRTLRAANEVASAE